jgi:hypothetical protein
MQCCVKDVGGLLPGLDQTQSANARKVIAQTKKQKLPKQACLAGITTGLTEVRYRSVNRCVRLIWNITKS